MPLPVIDGALRGSVGGLIAGGGRWANTWHFRRADLGSIDLALVTEVHVALLAFYTLVIFTKVPALTTLEAGDYTPLDGTSGAFHLPAGIAGTEVAHSTTPPEVAEALTIRTALRGRQNRGRVFLPAFTSFFFPGGVIHPDVPPEVVAGAVTMQVALTALGWQVGVGSYGPYKNPITHVLEPGTPHFTEATSFSMDNAADVQRSRKR